MGATGISIPAIVSTLVCLPFEICRQADERCMFSTKGAVGRQFHMLHLLAGNKLSLPFVLLVQTRDL